MHSRLTRAALAAVAAVVLLSGSSTTLAGWADAEQREGTTVTSGRLAVEQVAASTVVVRPGTAQPLPVSTPLLPGDVVRMTSTVSVAAAGDLLTGTLALDLSGLRGMTGTSVTTALPTAGTDRWTVTPAHDGAQATAVVEIALPRTTDDREARPDQSNWWGEDMQGTTLDAGAIRWTLTQETP